MSLTLCRVNELIEGIMTFKYDDMKAEALSVIIRQKNNKNISQ